MAGNTQSHPVLKKLAADALCAALVIFVFAFFHHVLPREKAASGIVIENPYVSSSGANAKEEQPAAQPENTDSDSDSGATSPKTVWADAQTASRSRTGTGTGQSSSSRSRRSPSSSSRGGMNSKGGSGLAGETAGEIENTQNDITPLNEKFAWAFTEETVVTDTGYTSPNVSVTVNELSSDGGRVTYYLADIYVRDITCFQTALAQDTYGSGYRDSIEDMASVNGALLAVNGDYYGNTNEGVVIRNGVIYRANPTTNDVCVLYYDGTMRVMSGSSFSVDEAIEDGAWQAWTFGPALLDQNGQAISSFSTTGMIARANPRTAIGYYEPGHYCMVVVDGRGESDGLTLTELSKLFESLGCRAAYNLDGGNSSIMVWQGEVINAPSGGGRESSDALLIAEVKKDA